MSEVTPIDPGDRKVEAQEKAGGKAPGGATYATEGGGDSEKEAGRTFQRVSKATEGGGDSEKEAGRTFQRK